MFQILLGAKSESQGLWFYYSGFCWHMKNILKIEYFPQIITIIVIFCIIW